MTRPIQSNPIQSNKSIIPALILALSNAKKTSLSILIIQIGKVICFFSETQVKKIRIEPIYSLQLWYGPILKTSIFIPIVLFAIGVLKPAPATAQPKAVVSGDWCDVGGPNPNGYACDGLFSVDLDTGKRTLISAFTAEDSKILQEATSNTITAPLWDRTSYDWKSITVDRSGDIFMFAESGGRIDFNAAPLAYFYSVDSATGARHVISPRDVTYGPTVGVSKLMINASGKLLAWSYRTPVLEIDPISGKRTILSDPTLGTQGPSYENVLGLSPSGRLFAQSVPSTSNTLDLIEINTTTGTRAIAANSFQKYPFGCLSQLVSDSASKIFCVDALGSGHHPSLALYDTSSATAGYRLSDFGDPLQGPRIDAIMDMIWGASGQILLLGGSQETMGGIYSINTDNGLRTLVSDFSNTNQGPLVYNVKSLAIGELPAFTGGNNNNTPTGTAPLLSQSESTDPVQTGQPFSYTVTFTNYAAAAATSVKLTDTLPKKSKLVSAVASQGKCKGKGKALVACSFGTVASGASVSATITVTRKKTGQVKNSAFITYKMLKAGSKKKKSYKLVAPSESTTVN